MYAFFKLWVHTLQHISALMACTHFVIQMTICFTSCSHHGTNPEMEGRKSLLCKGFLYLKAQMICRTIDRRKANLNQKRWEMRFLFIVHSSRISLYFIEYCIIPFKSTVYWISFALITQSAGCFKFYFILRRARVLKCACALKGRRNQLMLDCPGGCGKKFILNKQ